MCELHKCSNTGASIHGNKDGERRHLCSNSASNRSPSLSYSFVENKEMLNRVYELLFDEVKKLIEDEKPK